MLGTTHALIALAFARALGWISITDYTGIVVVVFFALLPDIDMPYSELGKIFFPISRRIYSKFGHRNITHSTMFMALVLGPMLFTNYFLIAFLAYGLHLVADSSTYTGIPWIWPYKKNFTFLGGPIITGKATDWIISGICSVVIIMFAFMI